MAATYFFYDLETTGLSAANDRLLEFAGQRVDTDLNPVAEPISYLVKLACDVIPKPGAILSNRISPLMANLEGLNEAELLAELEREVWQPETTFTGYNSVEFDDNFIRHLCYRNFFDPYAWQRLAGCSSFDLLPVLAFCRDLRPDGINWPKRPARSRGGLKLGQLAEANNLTRPSHRAQIDVQTTIELARLLKNKQPQVFDYLVNNRAPEKIREMVLSGQPLVYNGGFNLNKAQSTAIIFLGEDPLYRGNLIVYDLRCDPSLFATMTAKQLSQALADSLWPFIRLSPNKSLPLATLAVVKEFDQWQRLDLDLAKTKKHQEILKNSQIFSRLSGALAEKGRLEPLSIKTVDRYLYPGGLIPKTDQELMTSLRQSQPQELAKFDLKFSDPRLNLMLLLYKGRNWPKSLSPDEAVAFNRYQRWRWYDSDSPYNLKSFGYDLARSSSNFVDDDSQEILRELGDYVAGMAPESEEI